MHKRRLNESLRHKNWIDSIEKAVKYETEDINLTPGLINVPVEVTVREIKEKDAESEGVYSKSKKNWHGDLKGVVCREKFKIIWDSINSKRGYGWDVNPWVWVIEFRRVK
jgi:hypothetical protein